MSDYLLSETEELAAIARATARDLSAFNQLVLAYQNLAYSVAYRMLQDDGAAADAVQDSFIKAYRGLDSFKGGKFRSWLMRIVVNTCYDVLRARQRRLIESLDGLDVEPEYITSLVDRAESPEEFVERMELGAVIETGLGGLSHDQRVVVLLSDVHGYSYEEIAEIAQMPIGTVKSRLSRARGKLRDYLLRQPELLPSAFRPRRD